jgi:hypothetical protein
VIWSTESRSQEPTVGGDLVMGRTRLRTSGKLLPGKAALVALAASAIAATVDPGGFVAAARAAEEQARPTGETPAKPVVSPEADRILRDMGDYLKEAKQLSFHAEITHDDLLPTGQKIQLSASYDAAVRRPDRVYGEYWGDGGGRRFWYDGKTVTLYEAGLNLYASEPAGPTIDATLTHLIEVLGFTPPLSDLMTSDPAATLRRNVLFGFRVGETQVGGVRCQHLAFVERDIDWQIWIADGTQWVPRKLVITYKTLPGAPQFSAFFSDWDLATRAPDALFTPQLPAGAEKISFLSAAAKGKSPITEGKAK